MDEDRQAGEREADGNGRHAAEHHLAFGADVEQPGAETQRDAERGERHRRRRGERFGERRDRSERSAEQGAERGADPWDVDAGEQHRDAAEHQRQRHRQHRHNDNILDLATGHHHPLQHFAGGRRAFFVEAHAATPAIARPMSFTFAVSLVKLATMRPRNITRMRSARLMISSNSVDTMSTPTPLSRAAIRRSWMYSIEPTSTPRVGCEATISLMSRDSSRPTTSFC